jgi:DNA-binding IclR family transcriptional regulator
VKLTPPILDRPGHRPLPYVQVIGKAVALLDALRQAGAALTLGELAQATGLSRATTHRLVLTLARHQLVERLPDGRYRLGLHLFRLGAAVDVWAVLGRIAEGPLEILAERLSNSTYLSVRDRDRALCVVRIDRGPVKATTYEVGDTLPLHVGAAPLILLAALPDDEIDRILARPLDALTPATITDPATIRQRIARVRQEDLAFAPDDVQLGLAAMGVPIRDPAAGIVAAISCVGLNQWFEGPRFTAIEGALRETAATIEQALLGGDLPSSVRDHPTASRNRRVRS